MSTILPEVHSITTSPKHKQPMKTKSIFKTIKTKSIIPTPTNSQSTTTIQSAATLKHKGQPLNYKIPKLTRMQPSRFTPTPQQPLQQICLHSPFHHIVNKNCRAAGHYPKKANRDDSSHHLLKTLYIIVYTLYILT